jgi:transketolase
MQTFGASAPLQALQKKFGFVPEHIVAVVRELLSNSATVDHTPSV